jgi:hypothetical protein
VTSCSTRRCSLRSPIPAMPSRSGKMTTTPSGHTALSAICRQPYLPNSAILECNGTGRCATSGAPRPVPLHHRANRAQMKPGLFLSADETRDSGHCVFAECDFRFLFVGHTVLGANLKPHFRYAEISDPFKNRSCDQPEIAEQSLAIDTRFLKKVQTL